MTFSSASPALNFLNKSETSASSRWLVRLKGVLLALFGLILLLGGVLYVKAEHILLGAEAYIYGYPLVVMDVTRTNAVSTQGPENQLHRVRQFPEAGFKEVVRPNADTLYTSAFIDMAKGPWVFEMGANDQRYEVMPFMDAWTNVFAAPGTRTLGAAGGRLLLVGPGWQGQTPAGLTLLRSPTQMVWLIGRTQTNGVADYPLVHRLQDGIKLRALTAWQADPGGAEKISTSWQPAAVKPPPPVQQMQAMSAQAFFNRLARLLVANPPAAADGPMLVKLSRIGIAPGQPPHWSPLERWSVGLGRWIADFTVAKELNKTRDLVRGWQTPPAMLGNYGTFYNTRAVVAMVGLGANLPADAVYPNARFDGTGQALDGRHRYRLHFKAGELPPVHAFWSITAYGADDFFLDNAIHRYALGDRDPLHYNADGSLDLLVQATPPDGDQKNNWLPVKQGQPFLLNARLYWPKTPALNGQWGMPAVERID
ncbi:MAG: DUF1254 domain-containing protein [Rhodoferax sp.]|uniref:DUF1254 domain-containing protein n=1 Tax=Rhodoferax sp. TaxID=50421 RepID=UPI002634A93C|nr:DUF1254 domain-containing protein [Rhodoferax sp.]MDD5333606.1 DUF1254 domain-containing protein [Rhodoferax sp.]